MSLRNIILSEVSNRKCNSDSDIDKLEKKVIKNNEYLTEMMKPLKDYELEIQKLTKTLDEMKRDKLRINQPRYLLLLDDGEFALAFQDEVEIIDNIDTIRKAYKYPISIVDMMRLSDSVNDEVLEWVNKSRIPKKIYNELSKSNKPLSRKVYIDQKKGKAWAQMHFTGITKEEYDEFNTGKKSLPEVLVEHSVHIDLRISYAELDKLVQFVITENDIQSMIKMMKGESVEITKGKKSVQHSKVVSKLSGELSEESNFPSLDKEGAKLADELIMKDGSYWISPGDVGATKDKYAYMSLIWLGNVITGCERHDFHELFMYTTKANDDIFSGKFTIKCLKDSDNSAGWEIWKSTNDNRPIDSIQHSDIGYHYLVSADEVIEFGREGYREESQSKFVRKLK